MTEPKKEGKRAGAPRGVIFGASLALLVLPLLLVNLVEGLRSMSIPLAVELVRDVEYVPDADANATRDFLGRVDFGECWREVPSGIVARVHDNAVEQFMPGAVAPISTLSPPLADKVQAELLADTSAACWFASPRLKLVRINRGDPVELVRIGPGVVSRSNLGSGVRFGALLFAAAGVLAAVLGRRRVTGDVALISIAAALLQLVLWLRAVGFQGSLFGGELLVMGDGFEMTTPFGVFALGLCAVFMLSGVGGALVGSLGVDAVTREQPCARCGHRHPANPLPEKCPACGAAVDRRGVQWAFVGLAMVVTVVCVYVLLLNLGEALGVFMNCIPKSMTDACKTAWRGTDNGWVGYGNLKGGPSGAGFVVLLHQTHYLAYTAVVMFLGPFLLSWRLHRGARPSALALVGANWVVCSMFVAALIGAVGTPGVFVIIFQTQMLAALCWGAAGVAGAMLGHILRQRSGATMFEEVDG